MPPQAGWRAVRGRFMDGCAFKPPANRPQAAARNPQPALTRTPLPPQPPNHRQPSPPPPPAPPGRPHPPPPPPPNPPSVVAEIQTKNALPLLSYSCSPRVVALPTGQLNARRVGGAAGGGGILAGGCGRPSASVDSPCRLGRFGGEEAGPRNPPDPAARPKTPSIESPPTPFQRPHLPSQPPTANPQPPNTFPLLVPPPSCPRW